MLCKDKNNKTLTDEVTQMKKTDKIKAAFFVEEEIVLEDEAIPAAKLPSVVFPWWCWLIVIASVAAGCGVYLYITHEEKRNAVTL